jgi:hypothetical protein
MLSILRIAVHLLSGYHAEEWISHDEFTIAFMKCFSFTILKGNSIENRKKYDCRINCDFLPFSSRRLTYEVRKLRSFVIEAVGIFGERLT